ncbi:MAG: M48 family metalloprotease [Alphaproteobacteria bacterium]|nr:M48 family metalloprotease [Alphaproteobacteria bacterium]
MPFSPALAQGRDISFIRDTEIENTIRFYLQRIFEAAGVDASSIQIHLINDSRLNAFVAGGQRIFINTGLLITADEPGEVIGVLAHELGHITGGHLSKFKGSLENAQAAAIAGMLLGLGAALATGDGKVAAAGAALGQQVGERSILSYSRANEQAADQAAMTFLDEAGISAKGMLDFMHVLQNQDRLYSAGANPYTRTHPLTEDRIDFVQNHVDTSPVSKAKLPPEYMAVHQRMRAKLEAYLTPQDAIRDYPVSDTSVPAHYARSIAYMELFKLDDSLKEIDTLLAESPKDPFFLETKGDILKRTGKLPEAAEEYRAAVNILPWAALIRTTLGETLLQIGGDANVQEALDNANIALSYEPDMIRAWNVKGQAHQYRGETGMVLLTQAEVAHRQGDKEQAKSLATRAMDALPKDSASWIQAQDIIYRADDK